MFLSHQFLLPDFGHRQSVHFLHVHTFYLWVTTKCALFTCSHFLHFNIGRVYTFCIFWEAERWWALVLVLKSQVCSLLDITHISSSLFPNVNAVVTASSSTRTLKLFCSNQGNSFCRFQFCRAVNKEHIWRVTKLDRWGAVSEAFLTQRMILGLSLLWWCTIT